MSNESPGLSEEATFANEPVERALQLPLQIATSFLNSSSISPFDGSLSKVWAAG